MRINLKLMILFSAIITISLVISTFVGFQYTEAAVIDSSLQEMKNLVSTKEKEIQTLHARASEDMIFAVKNPQFKEYFELSETKTGNVYDENEVLQFSSSQREIKDDLDKWIFHFQNKFNVDETCLIDLAGQEHTRLVFGDIAPDDDLSPEEQTAPFFAPSFKKDDGQVHIQYPYVSPDSERWVFAYVTPIVLDNKEKPAIFHFEMPLQIFQELVKIDVGRIYVVDRDGFLIADSKYEFSQIPTSLDPHEDFPPITIISESSEFENLLQEMKTNKDGFDTYTKDNEIHYITYAALPTFGWTLVYEKPYSMMLAGDTTLPNLENTIMIMTATISSIGLITVWIATTRISKPLKILARECREQNPAHLQKVAVSTKDEISEVSMALNKLIDQVNQIERQKEEFTSMVTHELKTPLTPIIGWCQILKKPKVMGELTDKQIKAIDNIHKNAKRLESLIGDVLDVQKLDLKRMSFDNLDVDVTEFMEFLYQNLQNAMEPKKIQFINSTPDTKLHLMSDKNRIEQVLNNLILNAIDFVPEKNGHIEIGAQEQEDSILFYVKDNGLGIAKDKQNNLFKKFYQVDSGLTRQHGGSGLGLTISHGIIEELKGKIWVDSEPGKGSTFYFILPKASMEKNNKEKENQE